MSASKRKNGAEVIIVGAGPAGCLMARDLARLGHRVLLLDKRAQNDLGHDWWDTLESSVFDEVGLARPRRPLLVAPYRFSLCSPWGDTPLKSVMPPGYVNVDRRLFADHLLRAAIEAGAYFRPRTAASGVIVESGSVAGVRLEKESGGASLRAALVVDASGANGVLRRTVPPVLRDGFEPEVQREDCVRTYREIRADTSRGGRSMMLIYEEGPSWVSRAEPGLAEVFACVLDRPDARDPREMVDELVRIEGGMGDKVVRGGQRGDIPVRRSFDSYVAPGFMMVGDSACMANPLNGSGVSNALAAAHLAAPVAHTALTRSACGMSDLWPYNVAYKRKRDARIAPLHLLREFLHGESMRDVYALLEIGLVAPNSFWNMEDAIRPGSLLGRLPKVHALRDRPGFLWRLSKTLFRAHAMQAHYQNYPTIYEPRAFTRWRS